MATSRSTYVERCTAVVWVQDDHWGRYSWECDQPEGHDGDHRLTLTAAEPTATVTWDGPVTAQSVLRESRGG